MSSSGHKTPGRSRGSNSPLPYFPNAESIPPLGKLPRAQLKKSLRQNTTLQSHDAKEEIRFEAASESSDEGTTTRHCLCMRSCPQIQDKMSRFLKKFDDFLSSSFKKLGHLVAHYTGYFIIIPILIALLLGTGVQQMRYESDPEYLFSPVEGPAKQERTLAKEYFKVNFSDFDPARIITPGRFIRFIITSKDQGNILKQEVWDEVIRLDTWIKGLSIEEDGDTFEFEDLCARWDGECVPNNILNMHSLLPEILNGSLEMSYPIMLNPYDFELYFMSIYFGGFSFGPEEEVVGIKAMTLFYWLKSGTHKEDRRGAIWEQNLLDSFDEDDYEIIKADRYTSMTLEDEMEVNTVSVIPYIGLTVVIMLVFSVAALFMSDWVRAKPYLGVMGILSVGLSCMTSYGFLMYIGIPFIGINLASPFLMLGIGVDDMFVMLAAWRRTPMQDSVAKRLGDSYSEAAVSITITSLTDMVSFFIGAITPFPSVQIFCLYTGTAVLVTYIFKITFFGACMAIAGRREREQKHALLCLSVKSKSEAGNLGCCYSVWCAGGINPEDPWNPKDNKPHLIMSFFRDGLATILNIPFFKAVVLLLFLVYLGGALYGCIMVKEGLERRRLNRYDSYSIDYYDMEDKYFREYPYRIQVIITGDLNYNDNATKHQLLELHKQFESLPSVGGKLYTTSWIRGWYEFLEDNSRYLDIEITDEKSFIHHLRDIYIDESSVDKLDLKFNEDFTKIIASRFIIQGYNISDSNADTAMMIALRKVAEDSHLNVTVFHPHFVFFDQFVLVRKICIQTISFAAFVMMIMSLVFIPNPWCSLWVAFSIISIELGVVGYMTHWGVNLDSISMINLIMCIGFSVDFSAHISYAYLTAKVDTPEERVKECLYTLGLPILQGAVSTILGVSALIFAPSYIFITFFKTVFLVIFFGAMHGLLLLPVLLSILGPGSRKSKSVIVQDLEAIKNIQLNSNLIGADGLGKGEDPKEGTSCVEEDSESLDKDMGIGTSEEESSNSSLSRASASKSGIHQVSKRSKQASIQSYNNKGFVEDEKRAPQEDKNTSQQMPSEAKRLRAYSTSKSSRKSKRQRNNSDSSTTS